MIRGGWNGRSGNWVNVKRRLPTKNGKVMVRVKGCKKQDIVCKFEQGNFSIDGVHHWLEGNRGYPNGF